MTTESEQLLSSREAESVLRDRGFTQKPHALRQKLLYHFRQGNIPTQKTDSGYYVKRSDLDTWLDGFKYKDSKPVPLTYRYHSRDHKHHQESYQRQLPQHLELTTIAVPRKYKEEIKNLILEFVAEQEAEV